MSSRFETLPCDILQTIAFLSASTSVFEPPVEILNLLLTHPFIYRSLRVPSAPDLYAHIFFTKFDTGAPLRRLCRRLPDSAFAAQLLARCRLFRRVRRADFSFAGLKQDLWTALWMFLESDGLNERQLSQVKFSDFILGLARSELLVQEPKSHARPGDTGLKPIIVWLLCLALRRRVIWEMSTHDREVLYSMIFPFIFPSKKSPTSTTKRALCPSSPSSVASPLGKQADVSTYLKLPDPSTPAINLAFAIFELNRPKIPYHLPKTRAIAIASQRFGPTEEDYEALASYRTPLFADLIPVNTNTGNGQSNSPPSVDIGVNASRSCMHDLQFSEISKNLDGRTNPEVWARSHIPGSLTGVWEGVYRTVDCPLNPVNPIATVVMVKPMHFVLAEYISYDMDDLGKGPSLSDLLNIKRGAPEIHINGRTYRKYLPLTYSPTRGTGTLNAAPLDVILLGETTDIYDHAWGPHKFTGRVHQNGFIVLERERKHEDGDDQGLWVFEGRLHLGTAFLGRWRITGVSDNIDHGIFSLCKSHARSEG